MHCQGIACTRLFYMGLTSAEGQKLECFKWTENHTFINILNWLCSNAALVFNHALAFSMCTKKSLWSMETINKYINLIGSLTLAFRPNISIHHLPSWSSCLILWSEANFTKLFFLRHSQPGKIIKSFCHWQVFSAKSYIGQKDRLEQCILISIM